MTGGWYRGRGWSAVGKFAIRIFVRFVSGVPEVSQWNLGGKLWRHMLISSNMADATTFDISVRPLHGVADVGILQ
jgi:hypothetical protein